jgi:hypothetical protein
MRKLLVCSYLLALFLFNCKGQAPTVNIKDSNSSYGEFQKNANGLIYSDQDINALRFVVDSLNLKFKTCDLNKAYLSYPQAKLYHLSFESKTNDLQDLLKEFNSTPDLYTLLKKYNAYLKEVDSSELLIRTPHKYEGKTVYLSGNSFSGFGENYLVSRKGLGPNQKWAYEYEKKDKDNDSYSIDCAYIPNGFLQITIAAKYAKLIQYIDCMIDTAATIFLGGPESETYNKKIAERCGAYYKEINDYLNKKMNLVKKKDDYTFDYLGHEKVEYAKTNLSKDVFLITRLKLLTDLYLKNERGSDPIEELIASFISKEKALEIKRKRRVYGQCSMDNSPRVHAKNIAVLAAETHSWDIFLQAHLNIMNDRFERMSDGSYAWGTRQTYIKELEVLDINVIDMMLGLSMRAFNVANGHYNGTVWRIGKALSESKDRLKFEEEAKQMMKDETLDEFNRSLVFLLYHTYLNYLADKTERKQKVEEFKKAADQYPSFIKTGIKQIKDTLTD